MNRTNTPQIKSVTTTKEGRFWALKADGKLLAIVLYKTGAFELKRLIQGLAGLPVDEPDKSKAESKTEVKAAKAKAPLLRESWREAEAPAEIYEHGKSDPGDCTCHGDHMIYFAYGSNMDSTQMSERCPESPMVLGIALLSGHEFKINSDGVATIVPSSEQQVWGVIWQLSPMDEARLDIHEGVYAGVYRRESFTVNSPSKPPQRVFAFVALNDFPGTARRGYLEQIIAAGARYGFPHSYLEHLSSFAAPQENRRLTHQRERTLVFVYGTLKRGFPNHGILGDSFSLGVCRTAERLALYSSGIPFAVRGEPVSQIVGEAFLVDSPTLALLDDLEGHPHWYCRELVELIFGDSVKKPGWIYLFPHRRGKLVESGEFTKDLLR